MSTSPLRWGILGTANIAQKNWQAIRNSGNGIVAGVASRSRDRARAFIELCQSEVPFPTAPDAFGSYQELLDSRNIDAVYIPLPTGLRPEWVLKAAAAGKHIVCEKPCATSLEELVRMIEACRRHKVQFMDGVMFMHSERLRKIRETLADDRQIGRIRRIDTGFSFRAPDEFFKNNIRAHSGLEPHGCLGDLGWYCLRFALVAMNGALPRRVCGRELGHRARGDSPSQVPVEFAGQLFYDDGVSAGFYCSFLTELQQWAHVSGTRGSLLVRDFVLPFFGSELAFDVQQPAYHVEGCEFNMEPGLRRVVVREYSNSHRHAQETNLFRNFADQVRSGRLDDTWPEIALKTQRLVEACLTSARNGGACVDIPVA